MQHICRCIGFFAHCINRSIRHPSFLPKLFKTIVVLTEEVHVVRDVVMPGMRDHLEVDDDDLDEEDEQVAHGQVRDEEEGRLVGTVRNMMKDT